MDTFGKFVTNDLNVTSHDDRIFTGYISVEVPDRDREIMAIDDILKAIEHYMSTLPVISDSHTNRMVGKMLEYERAEYEGHPAIRMRGQIFKNDRVSLYDRVWEKVKSGEYGGLSIGGSSKKRTPTYIDGRLIMKLEDLEMYEIALCREPANPLALIDYVNDFAKDASMIQDRDGRRILQCDSILCQFGKWSDVDADTDVSNGPYDGPSPGVGILDMLRKIYHFTKPIRGKSWEYWERKLREENPDWSDERIGATIGSWEHEKSREILERIYANT